MYKENTKRFMIIFNTWSDRTFSEEVTEFDDLDEVRGHINLIEAVYEDYNESDRFGFHKEWGYVVLDFNKQKILGWSRSGKIYKCGKTRNKLELKDIFFRGNDEVPENYQWDVGEYEGWLQYRWGDGKNAIDYDSKKEKSLRDINSITPTPIEEIEDNDSLGESIQDKFDKEIQKEIECRKIDRW